MLARKLFRRFGCMAASLALYASPGAAQEGTSPEDLAALAGSDTPNYTGGLSRAHRAIAERIRARMSDRFPTIRCGAPNPRQGQLVSLSAEGMSAKQPLSDPDLAFLVRALESPRQEVRDLAAYTIGLLGPSAADAIPYLQARFMAREGKGGWQNQALERVSCTPVVPAGFRQTIPDALLPPAEPRDAFGEQSAALIARLYLDEDLEFPPGMMNSLGGIELTFRTAAPLLARILANPNLSREKHIEAVQALARVDAQYAAPALAPLVRLADADDRELRWYVANALVHFRHDRAVPLLIERIGVVDPFNWQDEVCQFGARAIAAEDLLLAFVDRAPSPREAHNAAAVLGCIRSTKSLPKLLSLLAAPDWLMSEHVADALGAIGDTSPEAAAALNDLARNHWSRRVRRAALRSLRMVNLPAVPTRAGDAEPPQDESGEITIRAGPGPTDHGLSECNPRGRFSIDGRRRFRVDWREARFAPYPPRFPFSDLPKFGLREFLRVQDGWLVGVDLGHYDGVFLHVSESGERSPVDERTVVTGFVQKGDRIYAYGWGVFAYSPEAGVLLAVNRGEGGRWTSRRLALLPSPPIASAIAPTGELLFRDDFNSYAIVDGDIRPLACEAR